MELTKELSKEMVDLINHHLPNRSRDTITWYENFEHETLLSYNEDGSIDWLISYFYLDFTFDTMIIMQRDNKFTKTMWRVIRDTVSRPIKPIRIMSDPNNTVLVKTAIKYGGEWHQDELWFY